MLISLLQYLGSNRKCIHWFCGGMSVGTALDFEQNRAGNVVLAGPSV